MQWIERQVRALVTRAAVYIVDASGLRQTLQVQARADEVLDGVEHVEPYGLTSHPHAGADAIVLRVAGASSHPVAVVVGDRRYRLTGLASGEVALHDDQGAYVRLSPTGIRVVPAAGQLVELGGTGLGPALGVVTGDGVDPYTGQTYLVLGSASAAVRATT